MRLAKAGSCFGMRAMLALGMSRSIFLPHPEERPKVASRRARLGVIVAACLGLIGLGAEALAQEKRVALVIGNDAYKSLPKLANATNDARAMDARLKALGWETILRVNSGKRDMHRAVGQFGERIGSGAVGLFFFAGHGIQAGERNYLIPVDAEIESEFDLQPEALDANQVLRTMEDARNRTNIVILDACRDNPLPKRGRTAERGLAVVSAPAGSFVAYASGPGQKAQDGEPGGNGVFTGELVKAMATPGLRIEDVFKRVAQGVRERTGGRQVPWVQASLQGDFYFHSTAPSGPTAGLAAPSRDVLVWQGIQGSNRAADFETFLRDHADSAFAPYARIRLEDIKQGRTASLTPPTRPALAIDPIERDFFAVGAARIREEPDVRAKQVGVLKDGQKVAVLGKVKDQDWYLVEQGGKPAGYVARSLLEDEAAFRERRRKAEEDAAKAPPPQQTVAIAPSALPPSRDPQVRPVQPAVGTYSGTVRPGQTFRDCPDCPDMVVIPAGSFQMGSPSYEEGRSNDEGPVRQVSIRNFALGKYEVTVGQFRQFVREANYSWPGTCSAGFAQDDLHPAVCVSWNDAKAYAEWLGRRTGKGYRLPSEAEWEYAARAGTMTRFSCGNDDECLNAVAWTSSNSGSRTQRVGGKAPNAFGLHDMHGNVWEWVEDCYNSTYAGAPTDGGAWLQSNCSTRVLRGGSWDGYPRGARSAIRNRGNADYRINDDGFRVARTN